MSYVFSSTTLLFGTLPSCASVGVFSELQLKIIGSFFGSAMIM